MEDFSPARLSKFMSLVLRHHPERIGMFVDGAGWADVSELIDKAGQAGVLLTEAAIRDIVSNGTKQRFVLSQDGRRIRASYGHSIPVDLGLVATVPPQTLFHGTAEARTPSIRDHGLTAQARNFVHLSSDPGTARLVGSRHGRPVVLTIAAGEMAKDNYPFYTAPGGVWLTPSVPARYVTFPVGTRTINPQGSD